MSNEKSINVLNSLLRGEISAVETYRLAIDKIQDSKYRNVLQDNLRSHERRVGLLRDCVTRLGGQPNQGSGAWGAFTKLVAGGATAFGDNAAISALEEGEDRGLKQYRDNDALTDLDTPNLKIVSEQLLPEQERTHRALSDLKKAVVV